MEGREKKAFRETIEACKKPEMRLEDKLTTVLTLFQTEMEKQFDRLAAISAVPLSLVARDQLLVKRLAYYVKSTRITLDLVTNELASITGQERETIKMKFMKKGAMYDKPPSDTILVGGNTECPFNEMLHRTLRINRASYLSPQHYALTKTAELIGDDSALEQLRKRTSRDGVVSDITVKFDPVWYALKEIELNRIHLGMSTKRRTRPKLETTSS